MKIINEDIQPTKSPQEVLDEIKRWCSDNDIDIENKKIGIKFDRFNGKMIELEIDADISDLGKVELTDKFLKHRTQNDSIEIVQSEINLTLGMGNIFKVETMGRAIHTINTADWMPGASITLLFTGAEIEIFHTGHIDDEDIEHIDGYANFHLENSTNFKFNANDTLTLLYDGDLWREISKTLSNNDDDTDNDDDELLDGDERPEGE